MNELEFFEKRLSCKWFNWYRHGRTDPLISTFYKAGVEFGVLCLDLDTKEWDNFTISEIHELLEFEEITDKELIDEIRRQEEKVKTVARLGGRIHPIVKIFGQDPRIL